MKEWELRKKIIDYLEQFKTGDDKNIFTDIRIEMPWDKRIMIMFRRSIYPNERFIIEGEDEVINEIGKLHGHEITTLPIVFFTDKTLNNAITQLINKLENEWLVDWEVE